MKMESKYTLEDYDDPYKVDDEPANFDWWYHMAELHKKLFVDDRPVEVIAEEYKKEVREMANAKNS